MTGCTQSPPLEPAGDRTAASLGLPDLVVNQSGYADTILQATAEVGADCTFRVPFPEVFLSTGA